MSVPSEHAAVHGAAKTEATTPARPGRVAQVALRSTAWSLIGNFGVQLTGLVSGLILASIVSKEAFGVFAVATTWSGWLNIRAKLGLTSAATGYPESSGALFGTYRRLELVAGMANLVLAVAAAVWIVASGVQHAVWIVMLLGALFAIDTASILTLPHAVALERELQMTRVTIAELAATLVANASAIALALAGFETWVLVSIPVLTTLIKMLSTYVIFRRRLPDIRSHRWQFDRATAKNLIKRGVAIGIGLAAYTFVLTYDNHLVFTYFNAERLSEYSRAFQTASWTNIVISLVISRIGYVLFSKLREDPARLSKAVQLCLWAMLTIGTPLMLTLVFASPHIIRGLYGEKWIESVRYLRLLAPINFAWMLITVAFWVATALNHPRFTIALPVAMAFAIVLIATPLTAAFGILGTIAGVAATVFGGATASLTVIGRWTTVNPWREVRYALLSIGICALVLISAVQLPLLMPVNADSIRAPVAARATSIAQAAVIAAIAFSAFGISTVALRGVETRKRIAFLRTAWRGGV
jgi:PST family polysaccharide transporter